MNYSVTLTSLMVYVNAPTARQTSGYSVFLLLLAVFLVEVLVVIHRRFGSLPADLDRVGSELNLVAYGVAVSLLLGIFLDVVLLPGFPSKNSGSFFLVVGVFFLFNLYAYGFNAKLSNHLRSSPPLQNGINTFVDIRHVLGNRYMLFVLFVSWMLGLIPTLACFAAQIFWG